LILNTIKKRPNTIPVFGPGKWLLGESRALKVGINAGLVALPFKNRWRRQVFQFACKMVNKKRGGHQLKC